jgi:hypothetical protein
VLWCYYIDGGGEEMSKLAVITYRLMELLDGERGFKVISYRVAQRVKMGCLNWIK